MNANYSYSNIMDVRDRDENTKGTVLVSVCVVTYNHEEYIVEALESILMQKTSFPIEILVYDDASTDSTQGIIIGYQEKHPSLIKPLLQTENQRSKYGGGMNPRFNYSRALGNYIACCDGDDYWTDKYKLEKQVCFMERNGSCIASFHKWKLRGEDGFIDPKINYASLNTIIFKNLGSKFFSRLCIDNVNGDTLLRFLLQCEGEICYIKDVSPSIYRKHKGGVWNSMSALKQQQKRACDWLVIYRKFKSDLFASSLSYNYLINQIKLIRITYRIEGFRSSSKVFLQAIKQANDFGLVLYFLRLFISYSLMKFNK